jgi:hypothetical protein
VTDFDASKMRDALTSDAVESPAPEAGSAPGHGGSQSAAKRKRKKTGAEPVGAGAADGGEETVGSPSESAPAQPKRKRRINTAADARAHATRQETTKAKGKCGAYAPRGTVCKFCGQVHPL